MNKIFPADFIENLLSPLVTCLPGDSQARPVWVERKFTRLVGELWVITARTGWAVLEVIVGNDRDMLG